MSVSLLLVLGLGCARAERISVRPDLSTQKNEAYRLKLFYEYRLNEGDKGYWVKWSKDHGFLKDRDLALFFEKNRDREAAGWARGGQRMSWTGWALALGLVGTATAVGLTSEQKELKWMGAYSLLPAAGLAWLFDWMGDTWFRKPAVDHYNRELKRELKIDVKGD